MTQELNAIKVNAFNMINWNLLKKKLVKKYDRDINVCIVTENDS